MKEDINNVDFWFKCANELKNPFVLFSGGKDSLAAMAYVKEHVPKVKAFT